MMKNLRSRSSLVATADPVAVRKDHPGTRSTLPRWVAVLALAIALAPGVASAQEGSTVTISSTFSMDWLDGTVGPDLAQIYTNGHEHTWTLMLHGTTLSHNKFTAFGVSNYVTEIQATSFELEFSGPDAATLNGIVSNHIAGGNVLVYLRNAYSSGFGDDFAIVYVWPMGPAFEFFAGRETFGSSTLFPTNANGYPVVGPAPFSIWSEYSQLIDRRPGNNGSIGSWESLVTFNVMPSPPRLTITRSNNVVIVSWPSPSTGFFLQQNNQLNTTNWVTPADTLTDTGTIKFISVDAPVGTRFYRLFKP